VASTNAAWRGIAKALPGPLWFFVWVVLTTSAPLVGYPLTHRAEDILFEGPSVVWWAIAASTIVATVTAARCASGAASRGTAVGLPTTVALATSVAGTFLAFAVVIYRWGVQVERPMGAEVLLGIPVAAMGAAIGYFLGRRATRPRPVRRYVAGAIIAGLGALLAPLTVQRGAEFSLDTLPAGSAELPADRATPFTVPAGGRFGVYAIDEAPTKPDCTVAGNGLAGRHVAAVSVRPGKPGNDASPSYRWIGMFDVPAAGTYSLMCRAGGVRASYTVGGIPKIRGLVGWLVHWPVPLLWLLGALPGLLAIAEACRGGAATPDRRGGAR
jgi:hypothetical protein